MTIEVKNPDLSTGSVNDSTSPGNLIDGGAPRWTQYIRLSYVPTLGVDPDSDYFLKQFGNSLAFMNWSSYNQWYPGTAIANDPYSTTSGDALSETGGPNFNMGFGYSDTHTQNLVWNGNFYDATMKSSSTDPTEGILGDIFSNNGNALSTNPITGITPFYANKFYNANISKSLIIASLNNSKSNAFAEYTNKAYSILGNDYLSRSRGCFWRVVPRYNAGNGDGQNITTGQVVKNNSFTLEIMFDKPILHVDTAFSRLNFSSSVTTCGELCNPYKHLTVSGQAMVRYSDATNTIYSGPQVILTGS
jgi:hypothetical protein